MQGVTIFDIVLYGRNATMVFTRVMVKVAYASKTKDIAVRCSKYGLKLLTVVTASLLKMTGTFPSGLHYTVCLNK